MPLSKSKTKPPSKLVHEWSFEAIGTVWWMGIYEAVKADQLELLKRSVRQRIEDFDRTYSRFRADSWVTKIGARAGVYELPSDARPLLDTYLQLYNATDGLVTPLVGQLVSDAGYDADYSLQPRQLKAVPAWPEVLSYTDDTIVTNQPSLMDFGAAGKGYLIDILTDLIKSLGVTAFCIDGSGDIRSTGMAEPLRIGLEQPGQPDKAIGVASLNNQALCGSAPHKRQWGDMHHIMNPATLRPTTDIAATWVAAETAILADGLATALFFVEPDRLSEFTFEHLILYADSSINQSAGFPAELFTDAHA